MIHRLLKRQIKKYISDDGQVPEKLAELIEAVNQAYHQFEDGREMLERSLELSSNELMEANSEMRAIIHAFPDLFFKINSDGKITYSKSSSSENLVKAYPNLIGKRIQDIPSKDVGKKFSKALDRLKITQKMVRLEYSIPMDNDLQFYEARLLPLWENQIFVIVRNITEAKNAELALIEEKERLAVTLRSIGDGVITTDNYGRIVMINKAGEDLTGWIQQEAAGKPLNDILKLIEVDNSKSYHSPVENVFLTGETVDRGRSTVLINRQGEKLDIYDSAAPIRDRNGNISGVVIVFRDITEKLKFEEELIKIEKMETIRLLASGLAHDFNNVLNAILGNITLAKMYITPDNKGFKRLTKAEKSSLLARGLTQQLLTFSKGGVPVKEICHLPELLKDTIQFVLSGSNVKCEFDLSEDILPLEIDKGQISQVIQNLIINSIQAMPDGGTIYASAENIEITKLDTGSLSAGSYVKISIRDEGIGIEKEKIRYIFDPYYTTKPGGSGLGLATSYSIVQSHDGRIDLESNTAKGTIFDIYLPAYTKQFREKPATEYLSYRGNEKILIMDDDPEILDILNEFLTSLGYNTECVEDGQEVMDAYVRALNAGQPYDVVIMDLTIPGGIGGEEAIKNLKKIHRGIKAIVTSGYSGSQVIENYKNFGFRGVIIKPYRIEDVSRIIHNVIKGDV